MLILVLSPASETRSTARPSRSGSASLRHDGLLKSTCVPSIVSSTVPARFADGGAGGGEGGITVTAAGGAGGGEGGGVGCTAIGRDGGITWGSGRIRSGGRGSALRAILGAPPTNNDAPMPMVKAGPPDPIWLLASMRNACRPRIIL